MTREEFIVSDFLLAAGYSTEQVRHMLAAGRTLFAKARVRKKELTTDHIITRQAMRDVRERLKGQHHTEHCWARLAWGDGNCECDYERTRHA